MNFLKRNPYLLLAIFILVAYLPVLLPYYHLKNDFVTQIFPTRFFIGESLYSNTFPWWNPYINYGIPQYGDMASGFWNPMLWLIAKCFGYTIFTTTLEEIFYILIGGWGIYKLSKYLQITKEVAIICAISFMSGGFIVGHLQHLCWITGATFFPYVLLFYLKALKNPTLKHFILGGIFGFVFIASTHPGLIIGSIYFFLFAFIFLLLLNRSFFTNLTRAQVAKVSIMYALFILFFSPIVWTSNLEVLQFLTRVSKVSIEETLMGPTTLASYISLIFPLSVHKGTFFQTDISMRNVSIGLPLLVGIYFYFKSKNLKQTFPLLSLLTFFILLAAGGSFKIFAHKFLPLLAYVRLNGEFSYFVFILLILIGGTGLSNLQSSLNGQSKLKKAFFAIQICLIVGFIATLIYVIITKDSIVFSLHNAYRPWTIKLFIDLVTIWDLTLISILIQLTLTLFIKNSFTSSVLLPVCIYLVLLTWLCLPFTGLGKIPRSQVQAIISTFPKGIVKPNQKSINENKYIDARYEPIIGSAAFYSKQIGYPTQPAYPILLNSTKRFYNNRAIAAFIRNQSYLFLSTDTTINAHTSYDSSKIQVENYTPTVIKTRILNEAFRYVILLQNNYPHWEVYINGKHIQHFTAFGTFIGVPLKKGINYVEFRFTPKLLQIILSLNILILVLGLVVISLKRAKNINLVGK